MPNFKVMDATIAGEWTPDGGSTLKIHHYTLSDNGDQIDAIRWAKPETSLPEVGSFVEYEVKGTDNRSGRTKVKPASTGGFSGGGGGSSSGPKRDGYGYQTHPVDAHRMGRSAAQDRAMSFVAAKVAAGVVKDFTFEDVQKLADAFMRDLEGPVNPSDVPMDSTRLVEPFDT